MHNYSCRKLIRVEYAHQLWTSYTALCHESIHGHSGVIEIVLSSNKLNNDQMVIDFGEIGDKLKPEIMKKYDHALFIPIMYPDQYIGTLQLYNKRITITEENPTAEYFAKDIYQMVENFLSENNFDHIDVEEVIFHETETGYAKYSRS